jgi:plastocyanin
MRKIGPALALLVNIYTLGPATVAADDKKVTILDACDPATFNAAIGEGTCIDVGGTVTFSEFISPAVLPEGHPGWTNQPSYLQIKPGGRVKITNKGGETHTFTKVAAFGGGLIPLLNLTESPLAPECVGAGGAPNPALVFIPPGGKHEVKGLSVGTHLFECCIHPWMRAAVTVRAEGEENHH